MTKAGEGGAEAGRPTSAAGSTSNRRGTKGYFCMRCMTSPSSKSVEAASEVRRGGRERPFGVRLKSGQFAPVDFSSFTATISEFDVFTAEKISEFVPCVWRVVPPLLPRTCLYFRSALQTHLTQRSQDAEPPSDGVPGLKHGVVNCLGCAQPLPSSLLCGGGRHPPRRVAVADFASTTPSL